MIKITPTEKKEALAEIRKGLVQNLLVNELQYLKAELFIKNPPQEFSQAKNRIEEIKKLMILDEAQKNPNSKHYKKLINEKKLLEIKLVEAEYRATIKILDEEIAGGAGEPATPRA